MGQVAPQRREKGENGEDYNVDRVFYTGAKRGYPFEP